MTFKEYRTGYSILAINKNDGISVLSGKIIESTTPYFPKTIQPTLTAQISQDKVVDLKIELNGATKIYTFPENSSVASSSEGIIFADHDGIVRELNLIKAQSEDVIKSVEKHKKNIADCDKLLKELDPVEKEKAKQEERLSKIESSVADIREMFVSLSKNLKHESR